MSEMKKARDIWREIPGWPHYEVSNMGHVRSLRSGTPVIMRAHIGKGWRNKGRTRVSFSRDGKGTTLRVSNLVMLAFIGPRPDGYVVAHLNGDPSDDRLENLQYCTQKDNMSHKAIHGTRQSGTKNGRAKLNEEKVADIRRRYRKTGLTSNVSALAREFNVNTDTIYNVVQRKTWTDGK